MRIAILCPGYGLVTRGVETFVGELSHRLVEMHPDWRIDIFCRGSEGDISDGVKRIHVPAIDRDSRPASLYAKVGHRLGIFLRTRIDAECLAFTLVLTPRLLHARYDLIFNQAGPFAGFLLRFKRRRDGTPFVHKTASGYGELEVLMARQSPDAVIATSPFVKSWLECVQPSLRIECIPNAVDCSAFRPYSVEELVAHRNGQAVFGVRRPIVLFVGAMDPMKRPELLIAAVARLKDTSLVMVGGGRLSDRMAEMGNLRLRGRFAHVPQVSRDEMAVYYNSCDLFTLPSEEPFGIAFLEAMACNKPVLGQNSPVQQWIFGNAGATCDCTDPDEYAEAIRSMLATEFGSRPLERSKVFDWPEIVPRYARLFSEVASARRIG